MSDQNHVLSEGMSKQKPTRFNDKGVKNKSMKEYSSV